jgi:hypothetical protein
MNPKFARRVINHGTVIFALCSASEAGAATLTIGNYVGTVPALNAGQFNDFPGETQSGGPGSTIVATSTATGGTLNGSNPVVGNNINTGYGATIHLVTQPGETFNYQLLSLRTGSFDDGLRLDYNGVTILDFDYSNYVSDPEVISMLGTWTPWANEGLPVLELDASGLRLMVTVGANGTGTATGVMAGDRINLLNYFQATSYVADPADPDFVSGVNLAIYNRNDQGGWAITMPTITATVAPVPEPSMVILAGLGVLALFRRGR